jgi:pimeloyl-ACP methyl ester carboxylesterase
MYYEVQGEGEPIILIAGIGTDLASHAEIIRWLSQKFKVLAFDNRGEGRTDKPKIPYTIEMMADDTAGLLRTLSITKANVIGISMGAHRYGTSLTASRTGKESDPYLDICETGKECPTSAPIQNLEDDYWQKKVG